MALTQAAAAPHRTSIAIPHRGLPLRGLAAALVVLFALDSVLMLALLGQPPLMVAMLAVIVPSTLAWTIYQSMSGQSRIGATTLLTSLAAATILLILGGEGRLLYAAADWQIRDAVLADLGTHRWPFDYWLEGRSQILRAPVGMYLVPALLGDVSQLGRDWALLAHNSLVLGLLFALGSALFDGRRARLMALVIFVTFSGLDVLGNLILQSVSGHSNWNHIERWASNYQYSSHITQLFWVPQHALAGWTIALTYLLWRRGLAPIGLFAASLPLVALWSPLVLFGALPFAVLAGLRVFRTGKWHWRDVLCCGMATTLAIPLLIYLSTDATTVGGGLRPPNVVLYTLIILLEVAPFLLPILRDRDNQVDRPAILVAGLCLCLMPIWSIGTFGDFQMRGSIMPLAILAIAFADWAIRIGQLRTKLYFLAIAALGSVTGAVEVAQAFRFAPSPSPHCSLAAVWDRQTGLVSPAPYASYFASRDAFPLNIEPVERVSTANPPKCWDHPWRMPAGAALGRQERP